jgi:hypothetical protein
MMFLAEPTDFWGIVVPGWIGAISGLIGGVVAVVSLLIAIRSNEKADAARAAGSRTRSVVADTIAALQQGNDDELRAWDAGDAGQQGVRTPSSEADDVRARHARRSAVYDALLARLRAEDVRDARGSVRGAAAAEGNDR